MRPSPLLALLVALPSVLGRAEGPPEAPLAETVRIGEATFRIEYHADDADTARQICGALERAVPAARRWGEFRDPIRITVHPSHQALEAAAGREGRPWMRAWARRASVDLQSPRTWSRGKASDAGMAQLLTHELAHCVTYQAAGGASSPAHRPIPPWFMEGLAMEAAGQSPARRSFRGSSEPGDGAPLRDAAQLLRSDPGLIYATSHRAFAFLLARAGSGRVRRVVTAMGEGLDFASAFERAIGVPLEEFERQFDRHRAASRG